MTSFGRNILWRRTLDWLHVYQPHVIAVTGSSGKTTTKQAITKVLQEKYALRQDCQPENTSIGIALGILGLKTAPSGINWYKLLTGSLLQEISEEEPDTVICEVGVDKPGEINWLARHLSPDTTVITNVQTANLNLFRNQQNIAHEIEALAVVTNPNGTLVINNDDDAVRALSHSGLSSVVTFGQRPGSTVRLSRITRLSPHGFDIEVIIDNVPLELRLKHLILRSQISSILAALAVAHVRLINTQDTARTLHNFSLSSGRACLLAGINHSQLIDDSSNATLETMQASLNGLRVIPARRRIAILGDIVNLASFAQTAHAAIGRTAIESADIIILVGSDMRYAGIEALKQPVDVHHFATSSEAAQWVPSIIQPQDLVLVCGASSMQMDRITATLRGDN